MADAEKAIGNEAFKIGDYTKAIVHFSKAIDLEATHVLYSNRSACYCGLRKYEEALTDVRRRAKKNCHAPHASACDRPCLSCCLFCLRRRPSASR